METTRFLLVISLILVSLMLWQAWEQDYGRPPPAAPENIASTPVDESSGSEDVPNLAPEDFEPEYSPQPTQSAQPEMRPVVVETDVYRIEIDTLGGGINKVELLQYPVSTKTPDEAFVLMDDSRELFYIAQGGLLSTQSAPTHENRYSVASHYYNLAESEDSLTVPLSWRSAYGLVVTKRFEFSRSSYSIKVSYQVENGSGETWRGRSYSQLQRDDPGRAGRLLIYTYTGAVISSPQDRYVKIDFDEMREQNLEQDITNGWAAMIQHYFVAALLPTDKQLPYRYYSMALPNMRFTIGAISPAISIPPGGEAALEDLLYIGPKDQQEMENLSEGLGLTVDFGVLWFIAYPLFLLLAFLHGITANWGWAIILVTVLLKLVFYPLSAAGYRSMANMRRVQPRIMALRERYKNDKPRLNQAMMEIYKEEKINPLGGCFPILVQIPVFIALYWVLLESVELRQASFIFWWQDLSSPDPYWVLPILMGITMFIQQKLNPAPMDPIQEKVLMILPFAFTIFFGFFPSGLVLYWVANNVLSIAQQWQITRNLEKTGATGPNAPNAPPKK